MPRPTDGKSLKSRNLPWIWAVVVVDAIALAAILFPAAVEPSASTAFAVGSRLIGAAIAPVVVLLLTSLLPADVKAMLVFWRIREVLPGHRAFSVHARRDSRISLEALERNVGKWPDAPAEQNSRWYQLYKKVDNETEVALAHQHYLLFRDIAAISLLLAVVAAALLFAMHAGIAAIVLGGGLFLAQYLFSGIAARNNGNRLVTNVLALHSLT